MKKIGLYAGSFDPFTIGHRAIIEEAFKNGYDKVIIAVGENSQKNSLFTTNEKTNFIKLAVADLEAKKSVKIISYSGLTIDCAIENCASFLIRGIRHPVDLANEIYLESMNNAISECRGINIKTEIIEIPNKELAYISSSAYKELLKWKEYDAAKRFVCPAVHSLIVKKAQK